jgi:C1A family cysteine protease
MAVKRSKHPRLHRPPAEKPNPPGKGRYGWIPDLPDKRDYRFAAERYVDLKALPRKIDLRPGDSPLYDQSQLGSCTGNAIAGALQFDRRKQRLKPDYVPSRLFIYYNERVMERTVGQDAGASIRDGIKSVAKLGAPPETLWPYNIRKFATKPPTKAYQTALLHTAVKYQRLTSTSLAQLKGCLAGGLPFVFGFAVYAPFEGDEVARTGRVPMPQPGEEELGGHAVLCVGYDDSIGCFIVRNSWGTSWGDGGYFYIPYDYLTDLDLADDFWVIQIVK